MRPRLNQIIDSLTASGSTALHATLLAAKDEIARTIDPTRINAIVLLYDAATDPKNIDEVMVSVFSNFG